MRFGLQAGFAGAGCAPALKPKARRCAESSSAAPRRPRLPRPRPPAWGHAGKTALRRGQMRAHQFTISSRGACRPGGGAPGANFGPVLARPKSGPKFAVRRAGVLPPKAERFKGADFAETKQQDVASAPTAKETQTMIQEKGVEVLEWPSKTKGTTAKSAGCKSGLFSAFTRSPTTVRVRFMSACCTFFVAYYIPSAVSWLKIDHHQRDCSCRRSVVVRSLVAATRQLPWAGAKVCCKLGVELATCAQAARHVTQICAIAGAGSCVARQTAPMHTRARSTRAASSAVSVAIVATVAARICWVAVPVGYGALSVSALSTGASSQTGWERSQCRDVFRGLWLCESAAIAAHVSS